MKCIEGQIFLEPFVVPCWPPGPPPPPFLAQCPAGRHVICLKIPRRQRPKGAVFLRLQMSCSGVVVVRVGSSSIVPPPPPRPRGGCHLVTIRGPSRALRGGGGEVHYPPPPQCVKQGLSTKGSAYTFAELTSVGTHKSARTHQNSWLGRLAEGLRARTSQFEHDLK